MANLVQSRAVQVLCQPLFGQLFTQPLVCVVFSKREQNVVHCQPDKLAPLIPDTHYRSRENVERLRAQCGGPASHGQVAFSNIKGHLMASFYLRILALFFMLFGLMVALPLMVWDMLSPVLYAPLAVLLTVIATFVPVGIVAWSISRMTRPTRKCPTVFARKWCSHSAYPGCYSVLCACCGWHFGVPVEAAPGAVTGAFFSQRCARRPDLSRSSRPAEPELHAAFQQFIVADVMRAVA